MNALTPSRVVAAAALALAALGFGVAQASNGGSGAPRQGGQEGLRAQQAPPGAQQAERRGVLHEGVQRQGPRGRRRGTSARRRQDDKRAASTSSTTRWPPTVRRLHRFRGGLHHGVSGATHRHQAGLRRVRPRHHSRPGDRRGPRVHRARNQSGRHLPHGRERQDRRALGRPRRRSRPRQPTATPRSELDRAGHVCRVGSRGVASARQ